MPFRLDEHRAKIQFLTSSSMPMRIFEAREKLGITSQTRYIQLAVCAALAKDLGLDYDELVAELPEWRRYNGGKVDEHIREGEA